MSFYKQQLKDWLGEKDFVGDKVLSVGNMNDDSKYFKSFKANEIKTIDNDQQYKPDLLWDLNDDLRIELDFYDYTDYFDDIFTFELWEYIYDPITTLKNFHYLLKDGGKLWISAPFIYPTHSPKDCDYLRYTEFFWKKVLPEMGFEIVEYKKRIWKDMQGYWDSVSIDKMRPAKDYDGHNLTGHLIIARKK